MQHRTVEGRLAYIGPGGADRGREAFSITVHGDGSRILRARSEIDETQVLRDVTYAVGDDWRPHDAFVRLTVEDRFQGSGWFLFDDSGATVETLTADEGRLSQRLEVPGGAQCFGAHPISGDAWMVTPFDLDGDRVQWVDRALMSSLAFNGATGPKLHRLRYGLEFVGCEVLEVPAGRLPARHFRFLLDGTEVDGHPDYRIWVSDDEDCVIVQSTVGAPRDYTYQLVSLQRR